jgi:hypothetical protein
MANTPDSPLFLQIDLLSHRTLYYRQDRCSADALPVSFQLTPDAIECFAVSTAILAADRGLSCRQRVPPIWDRFTHHGLNVWALGGLSSHLGTTMS